MAASLVARAKRALEGSRLDSTQQNRVNKKTSGGQGKDSNGCCWACTGDLLGTLQPWDRKLDAVAGGKASKRPDCWPASACVNPKAGGAFGRTPKDDVNVKPHIPRNAGNARDYKQGGGGGLAGF